MLAINLRREYAGALRRPRQLLGLQVLENLLGNGFQQQGTSSQEVHLNECQLLKEKISAYFENTKLKQP